MILLQFSDLIELFGNYLIFFSQDLWDSFVNFVGNIGRNELEDVAEGIKQELNFFLHRKTLYLHFLDRFTNVFYPFDH